MSIGLTQQQIDAIQLPLEVAVSASAGSGKTEVLVRRVIDAALKQAIPLDRMLIVTFTRSAAAELRERLRRALTGELSARISAGEPIEPVRAQMSALNRAQISTIHSFCLDVVQRYGYRLGLSAARILPDDEARMLRHQLAGELIRQRLDNAGPELRCAALAWGGADGVGAEDLSNVRSSHGLRDILLGLHDFRRSLPSAEDWYAQHLDYAPLDPAACDPQHPLVLSALEPLHNWCRDLSWSSSAIADELHARGIGPNARGLLLQRCQSLSKLLACAEWEGLAGAFASLDECLDLPYKPKGLLANYSRDVEDARLKELIKDIAESAQKEARELRSFYGSPWEEAALRENETQRRLIALWDVAREFDERYSARKLERGAVDYSDLESATLRLLRLAEVSSEIRAQFDLVLIDEYQDTSPIQDAILELAASGEPRQRFIVGDLKQSIYAFRLAEPSLFSAHQRRLAEGSGHSLKLTGSFRSRARVIAAINHIFDGLMDGYLGGEEYAASRLTPALDYRQLCGDGWTEDAPARLHLVEVERGQLDTDSDDGEDSPGNEPPEARPQSFHPQYAKVASLIREILASGQPVYDKALGATRPVQRRDIAVLLRTSRGRVENLRRELDRAGVPSYAPGRSGFYERPEVSDALSLLAVVDNPRQDIPLAAALTGPAVGLSPADLARIVIGSSETLPEEAAAGYGSADFFSRVERYASAGIDHELRSRLALFLQRLDSWRELARREPLDSVLEVLYRESGLLGAAAGLTNGAQRLANLAALADRASEFAEADRQGLSRFLEHIASSRRAAGDSGEAPLLSDQQDVVRVLTVHQAKGLEFPVVIVPDLQRRFNLPELGDDVQWHYRAGIGGRHIDLAAFRRYDTLGRRAVREARQLAAVSEELRILYVALTRARERLELVGSVEAGSLARFTRPRSKDATCWLQWIAARLGGAVLEAEQSAPSTCGEDGCWEVHYQRGGAAIEGLPGQSPAPSGQGLDAVLARVQAQYPYDSTSRLPSKVAITQLADTARDMENERALPLGGARSNPHDVQPSFLGQLPPSATDIGTATHKLLAAMSPLEFARYGDGREVLRLRYELEHRGLIARRDSELIPLAQVSQCAADLARTLPGLLHSPFHYFGEVPVNMLIPAPEIAALEGIGAEDVGSDLVHVQGAIDLLLDDGQTALVLDYKTGYTTDANALRATHEQQLLWYCRAACLLLPGRRILWALYGLGGAGFVGPFEYRATS